jgi:hypothetical protein
MRLTSLSHQSSSLCVSLGAFVSTIVNLMVLPSENLAINRILGGLFEEMAFPRGRPKKDLQLLLYEIV